MSLLKLRHFKFPASNPASPTSKNSFIILTQAQSGPKLSSFPPSASSKRTLAERGPDQQWPFERTWCPQHIHFSQTQKYKTLLLQNDLPFSNQKDSRKKK